MPAFTRDDGADGVGVLALALELHEQPVAGVGQLVVEDLGRAVEVVDHDVEPAVVVEVAHGEARGSRAPR